MWISLLKYYSIVKRLNYTPKHPKTSLVDQGKVLASVEEVKMCFKNHFAGILGGLLDLILGVRGISQIRCMIFFLILVGVV